MRPLRYSINVSLDGCCDHAAFGGGDVGEAMHRHSAESLARNDALLFGRVTYQMMEAGFRAEAPTSSDPFVAVIDAMPKHVVSTSLAHVDWNASLVVGDLVEAVTALKAEPGRGILTGGIQVPAALAAAGLIDEYELVVHPVVVGHGPTLFAGLPQALELELVESIDLGHGVVARRFVPVGS